MRPASGQWRRNSLKVLQHTADFSVEASKTKNAVGLKETMTYVIKILLENEGELQTFSDREKERIHHEICIERN